MNQHSTANRPHFLADNTRVWSARAEGSEDRYLALFNTGEAPLEVAVPLRELGLSRAAVRDLWQGRELGVSEGRVSANLRPHACALYRLKAG